ncbi:hypothetical protein [Clostridium sp. UBA2485]|uniref:hypothetical protein n=1 Tax=Clostridium sp. UBA2485 TaxID=1946352 RepID=UPI0025C1654E|nr:hypothetical protein [Clostridium sp. UBA2485]
MMLNELLEKINQEMFDQIDFDSILDLRDCEWFESNWINLHNQIEQLKLKKEYSEESKRFSDEYRKKAFLQVYNLSQNSDLAACISDDFGLIFDSMQLGVTTSWLDKLIQSYQSSKIPCGNL